MTGKPEYFAHIEKVSYHHPLEEGLGLHATWSSQYPTSIVSYHHPLEEGLGPLCGSWLPSFYTVSYHHPLEEGLGRLYRADELGVGVVSYHHPLEEGLGLSFSSF